MTVAHRLKAILDCDRIAVLSDGRLKEVGRPGVNAISLLTVVKIRMFSGKLKCLVLAGLSSLVWCVWVRPGACPRVEDFKGASLG